MPPNWLGSFAMGAPWRIEHHKPLAIILNLCEPVAELIHAWAMGYVQQLNYNIRSTCIFLSESYWFNFNNIQQIKLYQDCLPNNIDNRHQLEDSKCIVYEIYVRRSLMMISQSICKWIRLSKWHYKHQCSNKKEMLDEMVEQWKPNQITVIKSDNR